MQGLLSYLQRSAEFKKIKRGLEKGLPQQLITGLAGSQRAYWLAALANQLLPATSLLIVTPGEREAGDLAEEIAGFWPGAPVKLFPVLGSEPITILAQSQEVPAQRLQILEGFCTGQPLVAIAATEALLQPLIPPAVLQKEILNLAVGARLEPAELSARLWVMGYERVALVEGRGQFAVRGGIVDLFPPTANRPVRLEFFDDEIDSIRIFNVDNQRSADNQKMVVIFPAREMIAPDGARWAKAVPRLEQEYRKQLDRLERSGSAEARRRLQETVGQLLSLIEDFAALPETPHEAARRSALGPAPSVGAAGKGETGRPLPEGGYAGGMEQFLPFLYPDSATLFNYLPAGSLVYVDDPVRVAEVALNLGRERIALNSERLAKGWILPGQAQPPLDWDRLTAELAARQVLAGSLLPRQSEWLKPGQTVPLSGRGVPNFLGKIDLLARTIKEWQREGYAVVAVVSGQERGNQLQTVLQDYQIDAFYTASLQGRVRAGNVALTPGRLKEGFQLTSCRLAVVAETDVFNRPKGYAAKKKQPEGQRLAPFVDLKSGDYVVHLQHGIGRYAGIVSLTVGEILREYLLIQYAAEDKLYVPVEQVGLVQKYLGSEGNAPRLSRLGGGDWNRVKTRVKEAVREIAGELLTLYAARETVPGFAFGPDTVWQAEFEAAFPYEETADQLKAVAEVKADMERPNPMDRLLCGDVGYGKTEVALRAAFKAAMESKQTAVLAPTTILAQQHYNTFRERLSAYPVRVEVLSRFRSPKEQRLILKDLAQGAVDILIGTHRLIQEDVRFKDLGLLIIDEEQRFGVAHKEKLKFFRKNVDVLTLSATPIPRTLHMSLVGLRDTSLLETPPQGRYPVQTYVLDEDPILFREAIRKEIGRGGQVFFVYNRIMDMAQVALWLQDLAPEARIAMAHGKMREDDLEQVMQEFLEREHDVLVCTTIIENGLDLANVNTLLVKEADMMGLSQLYQLKGRVGRSDRLAYAYFTFRRNKLLGEAAEKRLAAIKEFTELGAGFKIAMRDLEIRGAGNILGAEQHGHIVAVGFDLYCRLLEEAVREAKGESVEPAPEVSLELPVEAYLPDGYIPDPNQKVEIYKRITAFTSTAEVADLHEELTDRFGDPPPPVENLLAVARVKALAGAIGVKKITMREKRFRLSLHREHPLTGAKLAGAGQRYRNEIKFQHRGEEFEISLAFPGAKPEKQPAPLKRLEEFLSEMA